MAVKAIWSRIKDTTKAFHPKDTSDEDDKIVFSILNTSYDSLLDREIGGISFQALRDLQIHVSLLDRQSVCFAKGIAAHEQFFVPLSEEVLRKHERNLAPCPENSRIESEENVLQNSTPFIKKIGDDSTHGWASTMCQRLFTEADLAPRKGTEEDKQPLKSLTGWRRSETVGPWYDWRVSGKWRPRFSCPMPGGKHPHAKVVMYHDVGGVEGEVLKEELLVIIVVMVNRLMNERYMKHAIIPIMLFSFMGKRHGRILLAHCTKEQLVLKISPLYRFMVEEEDWEGIRWWSPTQLLTSRRVA
ncbi:hypothetical protein BO71DRAFT_441437 [Aspergillus ellipticus CBS 707.79]|uniref:Uncharacterized protein n=1 Tax=Aspergillus ellipticus CBS 707.79 TaxID=1448320 RepID=A0A319E041_9EURO|nr:hypothetical protein BO71DRAFT_441437 [Aspergillus ellipticus CBS 707.79]